MEIFNDDVIQYLQENNTTIEKIQKKYQEGEETERTPSQEYIREVNKMDKRERYEQMKFEQQLDLLINLKQMTPKNKIYLNSKCLNQAIQMYHQLQKMQNQIE